MSIWAITNEPEGGERTMARMHNPPHPGEVIKELCLDPLKLTVTAAAEGLGVSRRTLSMLINGHAGISPDMAIRLSKAFGRSPESWLQLQLQYDLWQAEQRSGLIKVKHFPTAAPR
jgi:addiction module HigA family antidote